MTGQNGRVRSRHTRTGSGGANDTSRSRSPTGVPSYTTVLPSTRSPSLIDVTCIPAGSSTLTRRVEGWIVIWCSKLKRYVPPLESPVQARGRNSSVSRVDVSPARVRT